MPRKTVRVEIPEDPSEAIVLFGKVKEKHETLGEASPLKGMKWAEYGPAQTRAAEQDGIADRSRQTAEKAIGERNKDLPLVLQGLRSVRDVLIGLNPDNPKALGDWSFSVDDSPRAKPAAAAKAAVKP